MLTTVVNLAENSDTSSLEYWAEYVEYFAYPVAALLSVVVLAGLSYQETVLRGNKFGVAGIATALVSITFMALTTQDAGTTATTSMSVITLLIVGCMGLGAIIGLHKAKTVQMTEVPELIALLHSSVGLAAVLVGFNTFIELSATTDPGLVADMGFHLDEIDIGILIGAVILTGSIIAYLKFSGKMRSKPLTLPGRNSLSVLVLLMTVAMIVWMVTARRMMGTAVDPVMLGQQWIALGVLTAVSLVLGLHSVATIGGGDMPVVVSMLNSYSGWATAAAGFMLSSPLLIIVGALVGSSGAFLSYIMRKGMGRSFVSVTLGEFGEGAGLTCETRECEEHREIKVSEAAGLLKDVRSMMITPGYGMTTAGAQFAVADLTRELRNLGVQVRFGIYPVAGRLPRHVNMLLVEAKVPHDIVLEMNEINDDFPDADMVLVIGTNDTVNPDTYEPGSPIAGMPVLYVWETGRVVVFKHSMAIGYAGIQNLLLFKENTDVLFGDAKASVKEIIKNP